MSIKDYVKKVADTVTHPAEAVQNLVHGAQDVAAKTSEIVRDKTHELETGVHDLASKVMGKAEEPKT